MKCRCNNKSIFVLSAVVMLVFCCLYGLSVKADDLQGGWEVDGGGDLKIVEGYYIYHVTDELIKNGQLIVDFTDLIATMWSPGSTSINGQKFTASIKIINHTDNTISYSSYEAISDAMYGSTEDHIFTAKDNPQITAYNGTYGFGEVWAAVMMGDDTDVSVAVKGFDGKNIRLIMSPGRTTNSAVYELFAADYAADGGNTSNYNGGTFPLVYLARIDEKVKEEINITDSGGNPLSLPADTGRSYAAFLCAYFGVSSLSELSDAQRADVFGGKSSTGKTAGQAQMNSYSVSDDSVSETILADGSPENKRIMNWAYGMINGSDLAPSFFMLESDDQLIALGYQYLYDSGMEFTFDDINYPLSQSGGTRTAVTNVYDYIMKNSGTNNLVADIFSNGINKDESYILENVALRVLLPNAWSMTRYYDMGLAITFNAVPSTPVEVKYKITYHANTTDPVTGNTIDTNSPYLENSDITIMENGFVREGYNFIRWDISAASNVLAYTAKSHTTITADMDLYAVWEKIPDKPIEPKTPTTPTTPYTPPTKVNTGDSSNLLFPVILLVIGAVAILIALGKKKK